MRSIRVQREHSDTMGKLRLHSMCEVQECLLTIYLTACKRRLFSLATHAKDMHAAEGLSTNSPKTQSAFSGTGSHRRLLATLGLITTAASADTWERSSALHCREALDMWSWINATPADDAFHANCFTEQF